jgi:nucleotide-binding universal stress UspA family protein
VRRDQQQAPDDVVVDDKGEVEDRLEEAAKAVKDAGAEVDTHAIKGEPADVIIELAEREQADLIVVGNKGMTGAKRFVLGSVPNAIAHHAPCNVLIVRTT